MPSEKSPAASARRLMLQADRASLATTLAEDGSAWPYVSLALVAPDSDGAPLLLLSDLAQHSRNLELDPRAALLLDGTAGLDDPLAGARVTLLGELETCEDQAALARYLDHHPSAAAYAGFADFKLWRMTVARAHLVAGFGRIAWIEGGELFLVSEAPAAPSNRFTGPA